MTVGASTFIITDEARRRAIDARVLSALWIFEPGGNLPLLRFFFGASVAEGDLRRALERLSHARLIRTVESAGDPSFAVTATGLYALERGGLGLRHFFSRAPVA